MKKKKKEEKLKEKGPVSKCPDNTSFKQQRVPAWRLTLSAKAVLSSFFLIGAFCLAVGIAWIVATVNVKEISINYSNFCTICSELRQNSSNSEKACNCIVNFTVPEELQGDVFLYYGLNNFYQNHRRYVISRYDTQLLGRNVTTSETISKSYCAPFSTYKNGTPMAPCGAIANSLFNDTITFYYYPTATTKIEVPLLRTGNTWWSDKNIKFKNPQPRNNLVQAFAGSGRPPYWQKPPYLLDSDPYNNGYENDDFIIWMRVAAFPNFRKLYRRLSRIQPFTNGLPAGNYSYSIDYNFPVSKFNGQKYLYLTTLTWCGGKNLFLGIAYTVTGAVVVLVAVAMLAVHLKKKKKKSRYSTQ